MSNSLPPGQPPIDPRGTFAPPPIPTPPGAGYSGATQPGPIPPGPMPGPFPMPGWGPPPKRGKWTRRWLVIVIVLLGISVLLNVSMLGKSAVSLPGREKTVIEGDSDQKIAIIPVQGLITDDSTTALDEMLTRAEKDSGVKAVILAIDTPGGSASASDAMHHRLEVFHKTTDEQRGHVPVIVSMGGMATSGGYYVACGADYIFARPATMTANIGVLMPRFNLSKLCDKYGIQEDTIVATGGTYKNAGSMFKPDTEFDNAYLQGLIDATMAQFRKVVLDGRGTKLKLPPDQIFNGKVFMGDQALAAGLVDQLGYQDDACAYAAKSLNLSKPMLVQYDVTPSLWKLFDVSNALPAPASSNAGGQPIVVDLKTIGDLLSPRPLYLNRF